MNAFLHQLTWRDLYLLLGAIAFFIAFQWAGRSRRQRRSQRHMLAILSIEKWIERKDIMEHLANLGIFIAWDEFASMTRKLERQGVIEIRDITEPGIVERTIVVSHRYRLALDR